MKMNKTDSLETFLSISFTLFIVSGWGLSTIGFYKVHQELKKPSPTGTIVLKVPKPQEEIEVIEIELENDNWIAWKQPKTMVSGRIKIHPPSDGYFLDNYYCIGNRIFLQWKYDSSQSFWGIMRVGGLVPTMSTILSLILSAACESSRRQRRRQNEF